MRKITRAPAPPELQNGAADWTTNWVAKAGTNSTFYWPKNVREKLVDVLRNMSQGHCHFCDAFPLEAVTNEPIEHFRPKSECRELAYSWKNLYYICESCNSSKREEWAARMVAPDSDDYRFELFFQFDFTTGAMQPSAIAGEAEMEAATNTIRLYNLDSPARRRWRMLAARDWQYLFPHKSIDEHPYRDFVEQNVGSASGQG